MAVFFARTEIKRSGVTQVYTRPGDSGKSVEFHFCSRCASTVFWYPEFRPEWVGIAIGCFKDRQFAPTQEVYEQGRFEWARVIIDRNAKS